MMPPALLALLFLLLSGCALDDAAPVHSVYRSPDAANLQGHVTYVTDRRAEKAAPGGFGTFWAAAPSCGTTDVVIPAAPLPGQDVPWGYIATTHPAPCSDTTHAPQFSHITNMLQAEAATKNCRDILLLVPGFHTGFDSAVLRAGQMAADMRWPCVTATLSWTSEVDLKRYEADLERSFYAQPLLAAWLREMTQTGLKVHIIGQSMGARLTLATLAGFAYDRPAPLPVGEVILTGADIGAEKTRNDFTALAGRAAPFVRRITVYASGADAMLILSARSHGDVPRLGTSTEAVAAAGVSIDVIDATGVPADTVGHSYYAMSYEVLADMARALNGEALASRIRGNTLLPPSLMAPGELGATPRLATDRTPRLISHILAGLAETLP